MKFLIPFIYVFAVLLAWKTKDSLEPVPEVEIEQAFLTEKQHFDYERVLEIDSIQSALQLQKDSLLSGLVCVADCGIVRTGGQTVLPYRNGSKQSYSNEFRAYTNESNIRSVGASDKRAKDGSFSPSDAGILTESKSSIIKQSSVLATSAKFHP